MGPAPPGGTERPEKLEPSLAGRQVAPLASSLPGWSFDAEVSVDCKFLASGVLAPLSPRLVLADTMAASLHLFWD